MTLTVQEWLAQFASRLGVPPPSEEEIEVLLQMASVAAHASERTAAPLSCWLAARAGLDAGAALASANALAEALDRT